MANQTTFTKETLPKIFRDFGAKRLVFDVAKMNPIIQDAVTLAITEIKARQSIYESFEMKEDGTEDHNQYLERLSAKDPKLIRQFGESAHEHAVRVMSPRQQTTGKYAFEVLQALCKIFDQPQFDVPEDGSLPADYASVPVHEIRIFLFNVLNFCDSPFMSDFVPKRITDGKE